MEYLYTFNAVSNRIRNKNSFAIFTYDHNDDKSFCKWITIIMHQFINFRVIKILFERIYTFVTNIIVNVCIQFMEAFHIFQTNICHSQNSTK